MAVVAIHDADFFTYSHVIPNLECGKLYTYNIACNNVTVFTPARTPSMYSQYYLRKDYDDKEFPNFYFEPNVIFGGRAFTKNEYNPLDLKIEHSIPDFSCYEKYYSNFRETAADKQIFQNLLNYGHIRLSLDGENLDNPNYLLDNINDKKGIIIHDWSLSALPHFNDMLQDLTASRLYKKRFPLKIGNKFPIMMSNYDEIHQWANLPFLPNMMNIQYNGLLTAPELEELGRNKALCGQVLYNPLINCKSEKDFINIYAPELFKQILYLRRLPIKISLIYDAEKIKTRELRKFIQLLNISAHFKITEDMPRQYYALVNLCKRMPQLRECGGQNMKNLLKITENDARKVFMFFYNHNYDLFKMFYEWDKVYLKGGIICNEYDRN